jgi:hypothetical protein
VASYEPRPPADRPATIGGSPHAPSLPPSPLTTSYSNWVEGVGLVYGLIHLNNKDGLICEFPGFDEK